MVNIEKDKASPEFIEFCNKGIKNAYELIQKMHSDLEYHNLPHTVRVVAHTKKILEEVRKFNPALVDERTIYLGMFAASRHDTVLKYEIDTSNGMKKLKMKTVENERSSADEAVQYMIDNGGDALFTQKDYSVVREAIETTIPTFSKTEGVYQKNLNRQSSIIARAVALADLDDSGIVGNPDDFLKIAASLFREENIDIGEAIRNGRLSDNQEVIFMNRMIKYLADEKIFVLGRAKRLKQELNGDGLGFFGKIAISKLVFRNFKKNYQIIARMLEELESGAPFDRYLKIFSYELSTPISSK